LVPIFFEEAERVAAAGEAMVTTRMTEAEPMTIPSAVRAKRALLERKLSMARRMVSLKAMVRRALRMVFRKRVWRAFVASSLLCPVVNRIGACSRILIDWTHTWLVRPSSWIAAMGWPLPECRKKTCPF